MKRSANIGNKLIPVAFSLILAAIWEIIVDRGVVTRFLLPSPVDVLKTLVQSMPVMKDHILVTMEEAAAGFFIAVVISIILALLMDTVELVKKAIYPLVVVSQTVPIITLAPLFVMWFGFGLLPKIVVVVLVCFFPVTISLIEGFASVDADMINMMKSMGATDIQIMRFIKLPASLVHFFSGLRIAATYSIMGAVTGEWLGGEKGLGVYIQRTKHSCDLPGTFAAIVVIVLLSILLFKLISILQDLSMPWNKSQNKNSGGISNE